MLGNLRKFLLRRAVGQSGQRLILDECLQGFLRVVLQVVDHLRWPRDEAAQAGEALAEGPHHQVDFLVEAEMLGCTAALLTENADRVGFVDHQSGAVSLGQIRDRRQIRQVAHHREEPVDNDQNALVLLGRALQLRLQILHVVVLVLAQVREAEPTAVDDRRVVFAVADDDIVLAADRRDRAQVGLEPRREAQRSFLAREMRQPLLEFLVQLERAVQEARPRAGGAVLDQGLLRRGEDAVVVGQAQVVVAADHEEASAVDLALGPLTAAEWEEIGVDAQCLEFTGTCEPIALLEDIQWTRGVRAGYGSGHPSGGEAGRPGAVEAGW